MAIKLGKKEFTNSLRNTPNPFVHISLLSMFSGILFGFMWGKRVIYKSNAKTNRTRIIQNVLFGFSGIMANLVTAISAGFVSYIMLRFHLDKSVHDFFQYGMISFMGVNIFIALVSLLPLPGFDGFGIAKSVIGIFGVGLREVVSKRLEVATLSAMGLTILYQLAYYQHPVFDLFEKFSNHFIRIHW
ncbi:hypothetical protein [Desulfosporosinus sp. I2]|uniref:hypothetical protein n=1 Tax=Desulfosporosinus sp. I2 TaxID=1617025 RepID=UPI001A9A4FA5|nr:hypothetical protein [Desulfosporosinus sp. I2]